MRRVADRINFGDAAGVMEGVNMREVADGTGDWSDVWRCAGYRWVEE